MNKLNQNFNPPKIALRFFRWFCRPEMVEDIEGDLVEKFNRNIEDFGLKKARWKFTTQILNLFRPGIVRSFHFLNLNFMFRQNLVVSWRSLRKNKGFALINIGGLALAILVTMLIGLWVLDELTFNKKFENYDHLARVMQSQYFGDQIRTSTNQPMQMAPELRVVYGSFFDHVVTTSWTGDRLLSYGEKQLYKSGNFIEPEIGNMLSLKMIEGNRNALQDPSSILLSQTTANDIFGNEDALGKALKINNTMDVVVAGIYADLPENSDFANLKFIAPWDLLKTTENYEGRLGWGNNWFNVLVQLKEGVDIKTASQAIKDAKLKNSPEEYASVAKPEIFLHPMAKWHLYSRFENGVNTGGRIEYVR
ncbi:MAG: ABC transporter permease, partial [Saprospiraceae bacterium]|nr:ABC transporter permease [Saprospiraceae bacterium]